MSKTVVNDDVAIACIYFNHKEHTTPVEILGNLLKQLLERNPVLSTKVRDLYFHHRQRETRPTFTELSELLRFEASRVSSFFIVMDALDEYTGDENVVMGMLSEIKMMQTARLMITGRPHISNIMSKVKEFIILEIRAADEDICRSVKGQIKRSMFLSECLQRDETLGESIINMIVSKAQGM